MSQHVIYANVTRDERDRVAGQADREGVSLAEYVRRAVNELLVQAGEPVLAERRNYRPKGTGR